jgi:NitT/TauT family transport system ATP-binding protein
VRNGVAEEAFFEARSVWKLFSRNAREPQTDEASLIALRDVSLTVDKGEFVCIVGPSGCGKSTFLNMVAGFDRPTRGELRLRGKEILKPGADRGVVFQEHALFPWLTIRQNVGFGLSVRHVSVPERDRRVSHHLELVGLADFADMYPEQLSGGMRQRAAIARALANDPEILLMDEPFGALDLLTRESMQRELAKIWGETAKTVLFVTHGVDEAILLGDRVVVFSAHPGRIKKEIRVDVARPRDPLSEAIIDLKREVGSLLAQSVQEPDAGALAEH